MKRQTRQQSEKGPTIGYRRQCSLFLRSFLPPLVVVIFLASLLLSLILGTSTAFSQGENPTTLPAPNARLTAVREGKWPAQVAASRGDIAPDRHGPQRNDTSATLSAGPAEGIPQHAYSPFAERANREYPCPPGGCEFEKGQVLVELVPSQRVRKPGQQAKGMLVTDAWSRFSSTPKHLDRGKVCSHRKRNAGVGARSAAKPGARSAAKPAVWSTSPTHQKAEAAPMPPEHVGSRSAGVGARSATDGLENR